MTIFQTNNSEMDAFKDCENTDGLVGFYSSHRGYWEVTGFRPMGSKTKEECAKACQQNCVAISLVGFVCKHYNDRSLLIEDNERLNNLYGLAYIKCHGRY